MLSQRERIDCMSVKNDIYYDCVIVLVCHENVSHLFSYGYICVYVSVL